MVASYDLMIRMKRDDGDGDATTVCELFLRKVSYQV